MGVDVKSQILKNVSGFNKTHTKKKKKKSEESKKKESTFAEHSTKISAIEWYGLRIDI